MSIIYINPFQFAAPAGGYDADAQAYITAVEAADGQSLETAVKDAINAFFVGCKTDGNFSALKAACILAGARTLSGALVPLVSTMPAPTSFNFLDADYDRKTGLKGNGSTKYLDSNRAGNADPQNDAHCAVYKTAGTSAGSMICTNGPTASEIFYYTGVDYFSGNFRFFNRNGIASYSSGPELNGFMGVSRTKSTDFDYRINETTANFSVASEALLSGSFLIFNRPFSSFLSSNRLSFYSIGESLNLELLDTRVTTLINAFAAAIP